MQTNEIVIQILADRKMLKALAMFHMLKKKASHSVIYDYAPAKIAKITGLAEKTVRKYVKELLSVRFQGNKNEIRKVCELKDGHLRLINIQPRKHLCTIKFTKHTKISDIESLLYGKLIVMIQDQQRFAIHRKRENKRIVKDPKFPGDASKKRKILMGMPEEWILVKLSTYRVQAGVDLMCSKMSISKHKLSRIVSYLKKENIVKVKKRFTKVHQCSYETFSFLFHQLRDIHGCCFYSRGYVWKRETNLFVFLDYKRTV